MINGDDDILNRLTIIRLKVLKRKVDIARMLAYKRHQSLRSQPSEPDTLKKDKGKDDLRNDDMVKSIILNTMLLQQMMLKHLGPDAVQASDAEKSTIQRKSITNPQNLSNTRPGYKFQSPVAINASGGLKRFKACVHAIIFALRLSKSIDGSPKKLTSAEVNTIIEEGEQNIADFILSSKSVQAWLEKLDKASDNTFDLLKKQGNIQVDFSDLQVFKIGTLLDDLISTITKTVTLPNLTSNSVNCEKGLRLFKFFTTDFPLVPAGYLYDYEGSYIQKVNGLDPSEKAAYGPNPIFSTLVIVRAVVRRIFTRWKPVSGNDICKRNLKIFAIILCKVLKQSVPGYDRSDVNSSLVDLIALSNPRVDPEVLVGHNVESQVYSHISTAISDGANAIVRWNTILSKAILTKS